MANILTIPRSNALRFVNTTNYANNKLFPNFDNLLLPDEQFMRAPETKIPYFQKFNTGDQILIQLITNYSEFIKAANNSTNAMANYLLFINAASSLTYPVANFTDFSFEMSAIRISLGLTINNFDDFIAIMYNLAYPLTTYPDFLNKLTPLSDTLKNSVNIPFLSLITAYDYGNNPISLAGAGVIQSSLLETETVLTFGDNITQAINIYIDTSTLNGFAYLKINAGFTDMPPIEFTSELIEVGDYSDLPLIQWSQSRFDGVSYGSTLYPTIFGFRVESAITYTSGDDSIVYKNYDFSEISLRQAPLRFMELKSDPLPRYINEKLTIAANHDEIFVNKILCTKKGNAKSEWIEISNQYNFDITLQEQDYESYFNLPTKGGTNATIGIFTYDGVNGFLLDATDEMRAY